MKISKIFTAAILAAGLGASALNAQTVIYISGAPAVRQITTTGIINVLKANGGTISTAFTGANIITANQVTWTGGNIGGNAVTIKLTYNGSAAGIQAVSANQTAAFLADAQNGLGSGRPDPTTTANNSDTTKAENHTPDFTIADEWQASTPWIGTNGVGDAINGGNGTNGDGTSTFSTLVDDIVGVLAYKFVASPGFPASNITPNLANQLYTSGSIPLSQFTGNSADSTHYVYPLGRDIGSGARTITLSETGVGTTTPVKHWTPTVTYSGTGVGVAALAVYTTGSNYAAPTVSFSGGGGSGAAVTANLGTGANAGKIVSYTVTASGSNYTTTPSYTISDSTGTGASATVALQGGFIGTQALTVSGTLIGETYPIGDGGYSSFGTLLTALTATGTGSKSGNYWVSAISYSDAKAAIAAGGVELKWNGVQLGTVGIDTLGAGTGPDGTSSPALSNGTYSFWSYIRLDYLSTLNSSKANAYSFEQALKTQLKNVDAEVHLKDLNVKRSTDGGVIVPGQVL
jgi:hypothetical protein